MEKDITIELVRRITGEEFPAELEAFESNAEDCYDRISNGEQPEDLFADNGAMNEFSWEGVEQGVQSISVLAGTVLTFLSVRKEWKSSRSQKYASLKDTWQLDLIKSGVAPEVAAIIVEKYQEDLKNLLK
ncbi:hypothetical protein WJU16_15380 [Chitinophaga pollutisoli]|uniref:Immunity protein Imm6 n=1 Tax=Chitinophaga pollutisoli TaxID=3133966 RepID=A0ABZ2YKG1_9BACT